MKILLKSLAALLLILFLAIVAFVLLVDANRFKPRIEALAKDNGIALHIKGDLGWDLWPSIGVAVNDVSVAALETADKPVAELKKASLRLALIPLFSSEFQVDHIALDGAAISLQVDAAGKNNWDALTKTDSANKPSASAQPEGSDLKLDIERLSLSNSQVNYADAQTGQSFSLHDINLTMSDVNTQLRPFGLDLSFMLEQAEAGANTLQMNARLKSNLIVDSAISEIKLDQGKLELDLKGQENASLHLDYNLILANLQDDLAYQGQIKLNETNARKLLAALGTVLDTANNNAFNKVAFSLSVAGDANKVRLDSLQLLVDDTAFTGEVTVTDFSSNAINLNVEGGELNLDDYLPPADELQPEQPVDVSSTDTILPLETLRDLNINAKLALRKLIVNQMALENVALNVAAKNGIVEPVLNANAYSGAIATKAKLDARGQQAQLQFDADVTGLELAPLLKDMEMDSSFGLQGAVQVQAKGSSKGNSVNQLLKSLDTNASFSGAQVRVSPINLEQQFCKLVNLVNKSDEPAKDWEKFTELEELSGSIQLRNEVVTIETFKAGIEKLQLGSRGNINLAADTYDIFLPFKLIANNSDTLTGEQLDVATSVDGCRIGSNYWLERGLELLRCKGSFAKINPLSDCRPDKELMVELTKDYAAYKLKEKHGAKIEEKKDELKQKVEEKKGELLEKLQQRLNKGKSSAAASSAEGAADGQGAQ